MTAYQPSPLQPLVGATTVPSHASPSWSWRTRCQGLACCPGCRSTSRTWTAPPSRPGWPPCCPRRRPSGPSTPRPGTERLGSVSWSAVFRRSRHHVAVVLTVGVDGLGGGEAVAEARLSRLVLRPLTSTQEGRNGDGNQDRNDEHDHHQLDEGESTLISVPPGPQLGNNVEHCIPLWFVGCQYRQVPNVENLTAAISTTLRGNLSGNDGHEIRTVLTGRGGQDWAACGSASSTSPSSSGSGSWTASTGWSRGPRRSAPRRSSTPRTSSGATGSRRTGERSARSSTRS